MPTINRKQLEKVLKNNRRCSIITLVAITKPDLKKTNNPYWDGKNWLIRKIAKVNGLINWSYGNAVNNQLMREAKGTVPLETFIPQPRAWGTRIKGTPFVVHKENTYLELKIQKILEQLYMTEDGKHIHPLLLEEFEKPDYTGRQGLENPIILRDYNLDNIVELHMAGHIFSVKQNS